MEGSTTEEALTPTSQTYPVFTSEGDETLSTITSDAISESSSEATESPDGSDSEVITILMYAAPAIILVLLLIPIIICIVKRKRRKKLQEDKPGDEDVKSPIFEEDTPSVMEIEMDDLDKWMSNMKNSCRLSTLEEDSKFHTRTDT
ncbi:transmembrane protein 154 [Anomaloglossus baeobatrachus]|uniref:transmembrane protein 154 n=1 Tax=Anomaloglossus baeobatrachus TaxID=238106 RepID=UPI003F50B16C